MPTDTNKTLHDALLEFQKKVVAVKKEKENPHFKNTYADINLFLAAVKPILSEVGLVLTQSIERDGEESILRTRVSNGTEQIESAMVIPAVSNVQHLGSAITYLRRYSLQSLLALEAEDDDGEQAAKAPKAPSPEAYKKAEKAVSEAETVTELETLRKRIEASQNIGMGAKLSLAKRIKEKLETLQIVEEVDELITQDEAVDLLSKK